MSREYSSLRPSDSRTGRRQSPVRLGKGRESVNRYVTFQIFYHLKLELLED
jgi:hypothetical protein